ncbi:hypothetical protein [Tateyamaria sp. ANG-S1]|uniref:hypothetical protein n=1 Tax=Tateyamaria sp. ANG-S1 TaxID=1577905 RepID=UPI000580758E|nr:hypothetical protein [Tateyamaria sp. ANG-S1]
MEPTTMKEISPGFFEKIGHLRSGIRSMYRVSASVDLIHSGDKDLPITLKLASTAGPQYHPLRREEALALAAALVDLAERDLA